LLLDPFFLIQIIMFSTFLKSINNLHLQNKEQFLFFYLNICKTVHHSQSQFIYPFIMISSEKKTRHDQKS
jgi:hypothetical protein